MGELTKVNHSELIDPQAQLVVAFFDNGNNRYVADYLVSKVDRWPVFPWEE